MNPAGGIICMTVAVAALFAAPPVRSAEAGEAAAARALARGRDYLLAEFDPSGHWSDPQMPALTALPLWALCGCEGVPAGVLQKAGGFVLSTQREDGGFYVPKPGRGGSGLGNYNTSVCLSALYVWGKAPAAALLKAREYLAGSQLTGDDTMAGGFGYDRLSRKRYADLSNTSYALDAMRRTEALEEFRPGGRRVDVDWSAALAFVERLTRSAGDEAGGAAYNDRTPQAGATNAAGKVMLRTYGSMTYAAVLSMCHAQLDRGDPRVRQSLAYCERHWTLAENPGMGSQGLYYYYDILARALGAAGVETVGGHDWKRELAAQIVKLQRADGGWRNDNNRFWEADGVLCTAFAMLALQICAK